MSTVTQASLFAGRNLRRFFRAPPALVYAFAFPVLLLLTQYAVFGRIVGDGDRQHYLERLGPLVVLSTAAFGSPSSAVGFLRDLRGGLVDRLRTMPVAPGRCWPVGSSVTCCASSASEPSPRAWRCCWGSGSVRGRWPSSASSR